VEDSIMSRTTVDDVSRFLGSLAPRELAESWDNIGLLVGDRARPVARLMTCLTLTPDSVGEAVSERCDLVVAHHPLPFKPLARLTTDETPGRLLWQLMGAGISVYSAHTAFDSAARGINQGLAEGLGLAEIRPLAPTTAPSLLAAANGILGSGRIGRFAAPESLGSLVDRVKRFLSLSGLQVVGSLDREVRQVAVGCGSAGTFLGTARQAGCDVLVTGETNFHTCLEAEASGIALVLPGHFASERFGMERLAEDLQREYHGVQVWSSRSERDPLQWR